MTTYTCGALLSPHNEKDLIAEHVFPKARDLNLPATLDLRPQLQPVRDQGKQGSCVAQASACLKEWQEKVQIGFSEYMSPQFIYNNRMNQTSEGMYPSNAMMILFSKGCCTEYVYRYGTIQPPDQIPQPAYEEAIKYKIGKYARVSTIDGLKTALNTSGPCLITFPVYNYGASFWSPAADDKLDGYHCVTVVGYTAIGFIIRNSWGKNWNKDGYTIYPYTDFGKHSELWTALDTVSPLYVPHPPIPNPDNKKSKCCTII